MDRGAVTAVVVTLALLSGCVTGVVDGGADGEGERSGKLEVHSIDVGQADATLVVGPDGETMLIDSGHWEDDGETVLSYLQDRGIDRIDHLVTTHPHADHIGGHEAVIEYYETEANGIGAVYDSGATSSSATYEEYLDAVDRYNVALYQTQEGDEIPIDGVDAEFLYPSEDSDLEDANGNSLVLHVEHGSVGFLFTGDLRAAEEERLATEYGGELSSTVYQVGHHGSHSSSSDELLDAVGPSVAVISSAYDSPHGHPHEEPLRRFSARNIETYWTAVHGTVVFRSDGEVVDVATQRIAPTDPPEFDDAAESNADADDPVSERGTVAPSLVYGAVTPRAAAGA